MPAIQGWGTAESEWQAWAPLASLPVVEAATVVGAAERVVVVAPHPDDELLAVGGILAQLPVGIPIVIMAVTDGEGSHPGSATWTPERLRRERPLETAHAVETLGLRAEVVRLHLPDGGVTAGGQQVTDALAAMLTDGDVVITTWRGDGHPDHEAVGWSVQTACGLTGAKRWEMPIWTWHWARPGDPRVPWHTAVRCELSAQVLARKRAAVARYSSQLEPDPVTDLGCILPEPVLARLLRPFEVLFRT